MLSFYFKSVIIWAIIIFAFYFLFSESWATAVYKDEKYVEVIKKHRVRFALKVSAVSFIPLLRLAMLIAAIGFIGKENLSKKP